MVHEQRPDRDLGGRHVLGLRRRQSDLVADRDRRRRPVRHVLHGLPLSAGPAARPAADDPVAPAVRLHGALLVWAFAYLQYAGFNIFNTILAGDALHSTVHGPSKMWIVVATVARGGRGAGGLRPHPRCGAVADGRASSSSSGSSPSRCARCDYPAGSFDLGGFKCDPVPHPVRRGGRLPDQLGHLRLGLLPLPAAGRHRPQDVPVDLLGLCARRDLADVPGGGAGRMGGQQLRHDRVAQGRR